MLSRTAKIIISCVLSATSVGLYFTYKGEERKRCMFAMILCTLGDFFMVNMFGLGDVSTYPGAALFMIGHVVYGLCFIKASKRKGYTIINKGFKLGVVFVIAVAVVLGVLAFTIPSKPQTVMFFLILVYVAVIGFNLSCQFSYAHSEKGSRHWLSVGMALFLISDFIIFLNMLDVMPAQNDLVWATYIPAQAVIILFNSDFKKDTKYIIKKANQFYYGEGENLDLAKAVSLYKGAADEGDFEAMCLYGYCLRNGIGIEANAEEAFGLFVKSAEGGFAMAQYNVGYCYENGIGVEKNLELAKVWFDRAKENGYEE